MEKMVHNEMINVIKSMGNEMKYISYWNKFTRYSNFLWNTHDMNKELTEHLKKFKKTIHRKCFNQNVAEFPNHV